MLYRTACTQCPAPIEQRSQVLLDPGCGLEDRVDALADRRVQAVALAAQEPERLGGLAADRLEERAKVEGCERLRGERRVTRVAGEGPMELPGPGAEESGHLLGRRKGARDECRDGVHVDRPDFAAPRHQVSLLVDQKRALGS